MAALGAALAPVSIMAAVNGPSGGVGVAPPQAGTLLPGLPANPVGTAGGCDAEDGGEPVRLPPAKRGRRRGGMQ